MEIVYTSFWVDFSNEKEPRCRPVFELRPVCSLVTDDVITRRERSERGLEAVTAELPEERRVVDAAQGKIWRDGSRNER